MRPSRRRVDRARSTGFPEYVMPRRLLKSLAARGSAKTIHSPAAYRIPYFGQIGAKWLPSVANSGHF